MRIRLDISYDGTNFYGYQKQDNCRTTQGDLEKVLRKVFNVDEVNTYSSGRTDRHVHAICQVLHFDIETKMSSIAIKEAVNTRLPKDIRCIAANVVEPDFHSRYDAVKKEYHYVIAKHYDLFERNYKLFYKNIDIVRLIDVKEIFIGRHDFFSYTKFKDGQNTIREIYNIDVVENENDIIIKFVGNGFMRYQVRYLVGAMIAYSVGKLTKDYLLELLNNRHKEKKIKVAEPKGLYLYGVYY